MAAKKPVTHPTELRFAVYFLKYLHANSTNTYLILAVVAWLRSESGQHYIGFNPLNLRPGKDDAAFRSGIRTGKVGQFSIYKSLQAGARATATRLLNAGSDYRGYGLIVSAAQRSGGDTVQSMQQQATDFLNAIALSKWDASHYGLGKNPTLANADFTKNKLLKVWDSLLGFPVTLPADPVKPKAQHANPPAQAPSDAHIAHADFIQGGHAGAFYAERHKGDNILSDLPAE